MLISNVWRKGAVPEDWRKALAVPLFKTGDSTNIDNYRGIILLSLPGKVFAILLIHDLQASPSICAHRILCSSLP